MTEFEKNIKEKIVIELAKNLWIKNVMQYPRFEKIVLNMGIWTYVRAWWKDFSSLVNDLKLIAWQSPIVTYAKKSVSNFKLREWMPVWIKVTLRWDKMYAFLDKLVNIVLPRVRDFRWISPKAFDKAGNYNLWLKEHVIFPEVPQNDVVKPHWLQITIKMKVDKPEHAKSLLDWIGMPFKK